MKKYINPNKTEWPRLIERPYINNESVKEKVEEIITAIQTNGDKSLLEYTRKFDSPDIENIIVSKAEIQSAKLQTRDELKTAIRLAQKNIETYHKSQLLTENKTETSEGVICWRENRAIENIGLYIPGGSAPLFSTILMLGIPAKIAGCKNIILCTPPKMDGTIDPAICFTADLLGIRSIYKVGGAQAIAAMAMGTESIQRVDKIFGPGNQYVTEAKSQIQAKGVAIDMPAGPSELLIVADQTCIPSFVAADLLSQAEHGADSQVILVSDNEAIAAQIVEELKQQINLLPRKEIAQQAINNSSIVILENIDSCIQFSNMYAPEHLILAIEKSDEISKQVTNAGSVFVGNYSCESAGDYASGTNHTLPTNGYARSYSGVSVDSFVKKITFQKISKKGLQNIGTAIECMAAAEGLLAHKNAVTIRLKSIDNEK